MPTHPNKSARKSHRHSTQNHKHSLQTTTETQAEEDQTRQNKDIGTNVEEVLQRTRTYAKKLSKQIRNRKGAEDSQHTEQCTIYKWLYSLLAEDERENVGNSSTVKQRRQPTTDINNAHRNGN